MKIRALSLSHLFQRMVIFLLILLVLQPVTASAEDPALIGGKGSDLINLLLIGQDRQDGARARSDSIILCTVHPETKTVVMTSFLRDLYLPIPGYDANRLNAAYAFGGTPLLKKTLQENFGIAADGCLEVDFSSFPQIIDMLGGVCIELRQDEADTINAAVPGNLTQGLQQLNGTQALAYSRIRYLDQDGDFSRTSRQRKLLTSLLDSYRSADLLTILSAVMDMLPMVSTDLSKKQVLVLTAKLFPLLNDPVISNHRIPADGTYTCERIHGMDVLVADLKENKKILHDSITSITYSNN